MSAIPRVQEFADIYTAIISPDTVSTATVLTRFWGEAGTEEVRFRVKVVKNRWRIVEPMLPPHVGQKRMVNLVREAWVKETDPAKRDRLGTLQDELRKAK